jgi:sarcosine/dimethylglycine N-methyltransferase
MTTDPTAITTSPDTVARHVIGDFTGKQFEITEVADRVVEQYNEKQARVFYQCVMGGGGYDIHYGCFRTSTDSVYEASKATNERLLTVLDWTFPVLANSYVLDLGSGHGGISHEIAQRFGCKVMGANISNEQNIMNMEQAAQLGLGDLVHVTLCNFNEGLPDEWSNMFTHVISCEVLCHAADKPALFQEIRRVLQPGGAFVFTDIMGADGAVDEAVLKDFTDRNATTKMARPSEYLKLLKEQDFLQGSYLDFSPHLIHYFRAMLNKLAEHRHAMVNEGVSPVYLDKWMDSLTSRVQIQDKHNVFAWGIFSSRIKGPVY